MLPEDIRFNIGERIRNARTKANLSQMDFAESIDISVNFLSEIENGKKGFSYETLYKICNVHNISADYLLFGATNERNSYNKLIELTNRMTSNELQLSIEYLTALYKMRECLEKE